LALATGIGFPANDNFRQESGQTYALPAGGRVSLENINGDVHIHAWDWSEVLVEAVKTAAAQGLLNEARIEVDSGPEAISIRTKYGNETNTQPGSVEFTVTVPRTARLEQIKVINRGLDIDGVTGQVNAASMNGTLRACRIAGEP